MRASIVLAVMVVGCTLVAGWTLTVSGQNPPAPAAAKYVPNDDQSKDLQIALLRQQLAGQTLNIAWSNKANADADVKATWEKIRTANKWPATVTFNDNTGQWIDTPAATPAPAAAPAAATPKG